MCHTTPAFRDLPNSKTQRKNKQTNKAPRSATNFRARGGEPRPAAAATQLRGPLWGGPRGGRGQRSPRRAPSDASSPAGPAAARGHRRRGRPARTKLPAPAPSPTAAAAAPAAPHAAPRPLRLTSAARPARSRAATVWGREREKNPSLRKWRQLWGGEGGGGKKRSRGGSGRGVWNIESRRGLCSAGLRPEGGAAQRLRKKGGVGARLGEGASSRRGGGDAGDPRALWPPAAAARLGSSRPRSQQVPRRTRGEGRARRRRACSLLAWRRGARRRRPAGASCSRALPRALPAPPLTRGVHASARARPGQRARRGPGGLAPAALGRGACAREGGGAGTVSWGRCAAGWLPAWARLRAEAAHWATRVPRASSIPFACVGDVVAPGAPVPGKGPWARGWESPAAPGDGRLMGVVGEARHAGGEELPLAPRSPGGLCGFYPAAQSSQNTKTSCLPPRPSPATENLFR
ncbi:uncharacterized protein LOC144333280 [Macaca mulatta]